MNPLVSLWSHTLGTIDGPEHIEHVPGPLPVSMVYSNYEVAPTLWFTVLVQPPWEVAYEVGKVVRCVDKLRL